MPVVFAATSVVGVALAAEAPPLPQGLEENPRPGSAEQLSGDEGQEPPLPAGLGGKGEESAEEEEDVAGGPPAELTGIAEVRLGGRLRDDPYEDDLGLAEVRLQGTVEKSWDRVTVRATVDLLHDTVEETRDIRLDQGHGPIDVREAWAFLRLATFLDVKLGRQVLTWGTGDLVFINDLFPKPAEPEPNRRIFLAR